MIKQSMICVALASMALATSCSQDDMANGYALSNSPIKMNTSFKLPTRAVETTISNLGSFCANAFLTGQSNYMTDVKYTSTDGSAWTTTAGTFFWPVSGDLHIYCYAPDQPGQSGTYTINKDRQTLADFTPNTAAADQKDFVYAKSTGNNAQNGSTGIDIDFQHALSEITIAAKNSNTAYKVEVTGVKLGNIVNKGTFTFPSVSDAAATWTLSSSASDKQDYTTTWSSPFMLGGDATTMDAANVPFMIIPQQLEKADKASEKAYIGVKVKITMQGGQVVHNDWAYVGIDTNWEMGKRYAYTLDFSTGAGQDKDGNPIISGTAVKYNCSVTPWDEITEEPLTPNPVQVSLTSANSLIVNPTSKNVYGINIVDKINTFWASAEGDNANLVTASTEWEAEVIWQDIPSHAINFCDKDGRIISGDTYTGKGTTPLYVKAANNVKGNVVVGVKKKGAGNDSYLWSWHLWLTDEPQEIAGFMDRNLGATSANPSDGSKTYGLYYQFGRKDPFLGRADHYRIIYDINGIKIQEGNTIGTGKVTFAKSVNTPSIFYTNGNLGGDWASPNNYASKKWNDITDSENKTFFDPCPMGWKLPEIAAFSDFSASTFPLDERKVRTYKSNWFVPAGSFDTPDSYEMPFNAGNGYYWSSSSTSSVDGYALHFFVNRIDPSNSMENQGTFSHAEGFSVRCIQE